MANNPVPGKPDIECLSIFYSVWKSCVIKNLPHPGIHSQKSSEPQQRDGGVAKFCYSSAKERLFLLQTPCTSSTKQNRKYLLNYTDKHILQSS